MHAFFDLVIKDEIRLGQLATARASADASLQAAHDDLAAKLSTRLAGLTIVADLALTDVELASLGNAVVVALEDILRDRPAPAG